MFKTILCIGAGSCIGGVARYMVGRLFKPETLQVFPWGTFLVNILGCLIIGIIYGCVKRNCALSPEVKAFLTVGFCGGFTTFSSFMYENYTLFGSSGVMAAALYAGASFVAGMVCIYGGIRLSTIF